MRARVRAANARRRVPASVPNTSNTYFTFLLYRPFPSSQTPACARLCVCVRVPEGWRVRADRLICCCRAVAGGLQWISFIRPIRAEGGRQRRTDGRGGGGGHGGRGRVRGDRAVAGKHTPGAVRSQHLNTHLLKAAIQLLTAKEGERERKSCFRRAPTPFRRSAHPKDPY